MRLIIKLKPVEVKKKRVCPTCYAKGEVTDGCCKCHGAGIINFKTIRYNVGSWPIEIVKVDRDPKTGIIRYWENQNEFFYETITPKLNKYVPEVPFGIHLIHENLDDAFTEATRVNNALDALELRANKGFVVKSRYIRNAENVNTNIEIDNFYKLFTDNQLIDRYLKEIEKLHRLIKMPLKETKAKITG